VHFLGLGAVVLSVASVDTGHGAVAAQAMANKFMDFDTLAKRRPVNSKKHASVGLL